MSACLHVTAETANLARTLEAGGADLVLCASNPLSTQDDVAASLVEDYGIPVYAIKGEDDDTYYRHIAAALEHRPHVTMDDGADLVGVLHSAAARAARRRRRQHGGDDHRRHPPAGDGEGRRAEVPGHRRQRREDQALLRQPLRHRPEHARRRHPRHRTCCCRARTSSSPATAGAARASRCGRKGMGAHVIVTEIDPIRALEAVDGRLPGHADGRGRQASATSSSPSPATSTSIRGEHFAAMKDGAIICNSGHFNVELDIPALQKLREHEAATRGEFVDEYQLDDGRTPLRPGRGPPDQPGRRHGHPASVMDMSFANQALATEYAVRMRPSSSGRSTRCPRRSTPRSRGSSSRRWASTSTASPRSRSGTWRRGTKAPSLRVTSDDSHGFGPKTRMIGASSGSTVSLPVGGWGLGTVQAPEPERGEGNPTTTEATSP